MSIFFHIDGDSFFAAVEQALDPSLKGRPVITGSERGIASSMSREAKALGIGRGTPVARIRREHPEVAVVRSSYTLYTIFSRRMYAIARRYCEELEEYSIDEFFVRIDGDNISEAEATARRIQRDITQELGVTVSVGVAETKVLAKVASGINKPNGFFSFCHKGSHKVLRDIPVGAVWGIGPQTAKKLVGFGVRSAQDLITQDPHWVREVCGKSSAEIRQELEGHSVMPFGEENGPTRRSFRASHTFIPTTRQRDVERELSRMVEQVCYKLRKHRLRACRVDLFLKTQTFRYSTQGLRVTRPFDTPTVALELIRPLFRKVWERGVEYRAVGVTCSDLIEGDAIQQDLFPGTSAHGDLRALYEAIDRLNERSGDGVVRLCSSIEKGGSGGHEARRSFFSIPSLGSVM